jgi:hypothetical protein
VATTSASRVGCLVGERFAGAQEQHRVRPGLVHGPAAAAPDLRGEVLACLGQGLVGQGDQVEMIDRDRGAGQPHPQCFPERGRRVDGDDLHAQAPGQ